MSDTPLVSTPFPVSFLFEQEIYADHTVLVLKEEIAENLTLVFKRELPKSSGAHDTDLLILDMISLVIYERTVSFENDYSFGLEEPIEVLCETDEGGGAPVSYYYALVELHAEGKEIPAILS